MRRALAATALLACACSGAGEDARLNLLVVSIDTLRADRLGCYGSTRPTSPHADALAARGVLFDPVIAESSWTIPSHVSMLSGLSPRSHGVENPMLRVADGTPTLAGTLRDAGWTTFALTDGGWMSERWGFDQGFDSMKAEDDQGFARIVERTKDYVRHAESRGEPWFGFLHTYDVHCPYDPPVAFQTMFATPDATPFPTQGLCGNPHYNSIELTGGQQAHLVNLYDAGVRWVDEILGLLVAWLDEQGLAEETVVVVTSDHGEELFENGRIGHGTSLGREVLEVPWILVAPGVESRVIDGPASLADLAPTVLELLGVELDGPLDGRSWAPALRGEATSERAAYSRVRWEASLESVATRDEHLVRSLGNDGATSGAEELASELDALLATEPARGLEAPRRDDLSSAETERLRALGYLGED